MTENRLFSKVDNRRRRRRMLQFPDKEDNVMGKRKQKVKSHETEEMRLERVRLHKVTQPRVIPDKKKYNRKRDKGRQSDGLCYFVSQRSFGTSSIFISK